MKFYMKLIIFTFCCFLTSNAQSEEPLQLEHLLLVVPENTQKPSMSHFYVFRSEDHFLNEKLLTFDDLIIVKDLSELNVRKYVVIPRFQITDHNLPHKELMHFENGELYIKHVINNGNSFIYSKIATSKRYIDYSSVDSEDKLQNYKIYELRFKNGVEITQRPEYRVTSASEFILNIVRRLEDEAHEKKLKTLKSMVFNNSGRKISKDEINKIKSSSPGLKSTINQMLKILKSQLIRSQYSRTRIKKTLNDFEVLLYSLAKNVHPLYYKDIYSLPKETAQVFLNKDDYNRYQQDHVDDRVLELMQLLFNTVNKLDQSRQSKNMIKTDQYAVEALRLIIELYLTAGRTLGSISQQKTFSGVISIVGSLGFALSAFLLEGSQNKIVFSFLSASLFIHSLYELYSKNKTYKPSRWVYPGVKKFVQKRNSKEIRAEKIKMGFEIEVPGNSKYTNAIWYNFTVGHAISNHDFLKQLLRIVKMSSGKELFLTLNSMNSSFNCRTLF